MTYCRDCKKKADDDARFCPFCGAAVFEAPSLEEASAPASAGSVRKRRIIICMTLLAALFLIAVAVQRVTAGFLKNARSQTADETRLSEEAAGGETDRTEEPTTVKVGTEVGNICIFGHYTQAGEGEAPIRWLVLKKEKDRILVISQYALDCRKYNTDYENTTWETCSLRRWLNDTFFTAAFTPREQSRILTADVAAGTNAAFGTNAGKSTADRVFLLSIEEAETLFLSDDERKCGATAFAKNRGAWTDAAGGCWWLLRSPGGAADSVAGVSYAGKTDPYGCSVDYANAAVRPAMWLSTDA